MMLRWWKVTYLDCFGVMSIYEEEEYYQARTRKGAWKAFMKAHDNKPESGYQSNFDYETMKKDITWVSKPPEDEG